MSSPDPIYLRDHREDKDFAIEIPLDPATLSSQLPSIKECLRLEFAPIQIWHRIGIELYRHGLDTECNSLLGLALEDDLEHIQDWNTTACPYEGNPEKHINLLNAATVQAINSLNKLNSSHSEDNEYKINIRKATQYYQLARNIAQRYDRTEKYNMVLHFLAGLIQIEKAKHKREDLLQIMVKTKHNLQQAISWKEMQDDEEDRDLNEDGNDPHKAPLEREPNFISLLCIAVLSYATGEYEDSLTNFTKLLKMSLRSNGNMDIDTGNRHYLGFVHLGIGISSLKLREFDIARHAFERAKKIDKVRNSDKVGFVGIKSRIGLALVYLNQFDYVNGNKNQNGNNGKKVSSMRKALREITDAMRYCPNNPQLLVLMANFIGFSCDTMQFTKMWAGTAYYECLRLTGLHSKEATPKEIMSGLDTKYGLNAGTTQTHPLSKCQSEACYVIGKMYHISLDYNEAIKWYYKSVLLCPSFTLSLFGLAQMYIYFEKISHSKTCLEKIFKINSKNNIASDVSILSTYAYVCRQCGDFELAKTNLERAIALDPSQIDLYIDLAEITEQNSPEYAIKKYMKAKALFDKDASSDKVIPFELFNNIIVLFYQLGQYEKAKKLSEELIEITKDECMNIESNAQVIIQYNYARILDKLSLYKKARKIYRNIVPKCPSFIEAILCNALYLYRSGKYMDAIRKFEDAAKTAHSYNEINIELNALLYIQRIYQEIGRRSDSENVLKKIEILKKENKGNLLIRNDEYSELISANYIINSSNNRKSNYYKRLLDALRKYQQILVVNENNVYAVHGLAVIATESIENLSTAKNILSKLSRECIECDDINHNKSISDILCNLGHVHSVEQDWDGALKCYEKAKKKIVGGDMGDMGDIPLYIVRTLFAKKDFVMAKRELYQILRYNPTQELYLYNLALIEEEYACDILRKDPKKRTLLQIENVMKMLGSAQRLYQRLQNNRKTATQIPFDRLKQHLSHIKNELLQNAKKHLTFQKNQEMKNEKKRLSELKKLNRTLERQQREKEKLKLISEKKKNLNKLKAKEAKNKAKLISFVEPMNGGSNRKRKRGRDQREMGEIEIENMNEPSHKRVKMDEDNEDNHMDQFDILGRNEEETSEKKVLRKKKKLKKKRRKESVETETDHRIDQQIWAQMEIKIIEIVTNADLNTLTNRQVKKALAELFPQINIKVYKKLIKEKINIVAQQKADQE